MAVIALIIGDRTTRERSNKAIHFSVVITLLLQRCLRIRNHLVWRQPVVGVDRSIPRIIGVGIVTPSWEPVARVPVIRRSERKRDVVTVMTAPPVLIVPL